MYFIARKTNVIMLWLNARIFSTHPYFLAINIGQREYNIAAHQPPAVLLV
jgi:hypothetical protein